MKGVNLYLGPHITRKQARGLGHSFYLSLMTCPHGHHCPKFTEAKECRDCRKMKNNSQEKRVALQAWASANPDYMKEYYAKNRHSKLAAQTARYNQRSPEEIERGRATVRRAMKKFRFRHPEKMRAQERNRRARKAGAEGFHTADDLEFIRNVQGGICAYYWHCGNLLAEGEHIEHIIPLSRGGSNWPDNINLTCPSCNLRKGTRTHGEFVAHLKNRRGGAA